jgi:multimeric flavodoxin WrbA
VVALLGSRRKANTYSLLLQIKELLARQDTELEIIELYQYDIQDCCGCTVCVMKGNCILHDDMSQLEEKLAHADGIILASPVYLQQVSGKMKTFIDRTCAWYHRPVLAGKPLLSVATTKGSGLKATLAYLENVAVQWGAIPAGRIGRTIFNGEKAVSAKEVGQFCRLLTAPETYVPRLRQLIDFEVQKSLAQMLSPMDAAYWQAKNWTAQPYFYPCRINFLKRSISGLTGRIMRKNMAKGGHGENVS